MYTFPSKYVSVKVRTLHINLIYAFAWTVKRDIFNCRAGLSGRLRSSVRVVRVRARREIIILRISPVCLAVFNYALSLDVTNNVAVFHATAGEKNARGRFRRFARFADVLRALMTAGRRGRCRPKKKTDPFTAAELSYFPTEIFSERSENTRSERKKRKQMLFYRFTWRGKKTTCRFLRVFFFCWDIWNMRC